MFLAFKQVSAQMGIGTSNPENSAQLDVSSNKKGILLPRITLTSTKVQAPVKDAATSLLIYNTATTGDVTPGFYYWDGIQWIRMARSDESTFDALTEEQKETLKGEQGNPGERGIAGTPGTKGDKGDKGDRGDSGSGGMISYGGASPTDAGSSATFTLSRNNKVSDFTLWMWSNGCSKFSIATFTAYDDNIIFKGGSAGDIPYTATRTGNNVLKLTNTLGNTECQYGTPNHYNYTFSKNGSVITITNNSNTGTYDSAVYILVQNGL